MTRTPLPTDAITHQNAWHVLHHYKADGGWPPVLFTQALIGMLVGAHPSSSSRIALGCPGLVQAVRIAERGPAGIKALQKIAAHGAQGEINAAVADLPEADAPLVDYHAELDRLTTALAQAEAAADARHLPEIARLNGLLADAAGIGELRDAAVGRADLAEEQARSLGIQINGKFDETTMGREAKNLRRLYEQAAADRDQFKTDLLAAQATIRELDGTVLEVLSDRDHFHETLDRFAGMVAPIGVIGEHSSGNYPWVNAMDLVTPAAEVQQLRQDLADALARIAASPTHRAEDLPDPDHAQIPANSSNGVHS